MPASTAPSLSHINTEITNGNFPAIVAGLDSRSPADPRTTLTDDLTRGDIRAAQYMQVVSIH